MDENSHLMEQMPPNIGRYKVLESIGFGAMGAVYKAFDPLIKRTLAIKTIRLDIPRQSPQYKSFIERFYHEARISGTLSHPNIVTLFDIGEEGGVPYLAMEFVEGETISSLIDRGNRFDPEKVIALVSQIASAVDYAHTKGVIHRDIKPSNLILYEGDRVKVTDFGIAKLVDAEMTQSGTLLGTPSYMSPEQAMGDKLDGRSDIFSLGVCAFEMLSGEQPFPGNNVTSILYKLVHVDPIEPANLEMHGLVPQKWHEVFGKVLAKKPDERYQTATAFVQDLEYCLGSWFGSAMGDETVATVAPGVPAAPASAPAPARPAAPAAPPAPPASAATGDETVTARIPAIPLPAAATKTPPPVPVPAAPPAAAPAASGDEALPATVYMKTPNPAAVPQRETGETTVGRATPSPLSPRATAALPPSTPPAPKPGDAKAGPKGTLALEPDSAAAPTVRTKLAAAPGAPEPTVLIKGEPPVETVRVTAGDAQKAARRQPPPAPAPEPAGAVEATVLMAVPDPTMKGPVPATTRMPVKAPPPPPTAKAKAPPLPPPPTAPPLPVAPPLAAETPGPARSGIPAGLIIGGLAFAFVLVVVIALALFLNRPRPEPSATPQPAPSVVAATPTAAPSEAPPAVSTGSLQVDSQPPGATITLNGELRGTTPLALDSLVLGAYEVKADLKGYESKKQDVVLTAEAPTSQVALTLSRLAPINGIADVVSTPFGAAVSVDGTRIGQTPVTDHRLRPGSHRVEITKDGYEPWSGTLVVEAGKRGRIDAVLRAIPKQTPTPEPKVDVADPNRVYLPNEVDVPAKRVSGTSPSYPSDRAPPLRSGDSISVTVSFVVTETGEVTDLKVMESANKIVDEAVLGAIRSWKYTPATKNGTKVKVRMALKQTFRTG
jgi:serine/threonine-protein kinase